MLNRKPFVAIAAAALVALGATASRLDIFVPIPHSQAATTAAPSVAVGRVLPDFSSLVTAAGPAVVNVSVTQNARTPAALQGVDPNDPFFEFFRRFQTPSPQAVPRQGLGSGFIVSSDGFILTNAHVVDNANEVTVRLTDKREFKARVIGVDKRTDVALIKIDGKGLPTVKVGDSSQAKVGEWVAAIGSPFGFENSVTAGIISAKARSLPDESLVPFLQTDVAVNPGNSGGPLLNVNGEVIGINSQIYSRTGGYMGVSFAIPIEVAMKVKDDLQKFGKVNRGRLGVAVQPVSTDLADSFGMKGAKGALVNSVEADSPAAKAGIVAGDVIVSVNDRSIDEPADLVRAISDTAPGANVRLKIWRQGTARDVTARVVAIAPEKSAPTAAISPQSSEKLGLMVRPLTPDEQKQIGSSNGLVVEQAAGPAASAGITRGDVILAVNNEQIKTVDQLRHLIEGHKGSVAILIQREDQRIYVPMRIG